MMTTLVIIAAVIMPTQLSCMQHLEAETNRAPLASVIYDHGVSRKLIELHGGHIVLDCNGSKYTANLLEERPWPKTYVRTQWR